MKLIPNEWRYFDETLNMPYPWYVKQVLAVLEQIDLKGKRIFEYGCGDSTLWYRAKGALVCGVDSNEVWLNKLGCGAYFGHDEKSYLSSIEGMYTLFEELFDIIVIDGDYRDKCLGYAIKHIKKDGFIIIDNFEQPSVDADWPITRKLIHDIGLKLEIYKEKEHYDWQTAIVRL